SRRALEGDGGGLRPAARAQQDEVNRLVDAALGVLGTTADGGIGDRLHTTLHAAATDAAVGDLLRRGRLVADAEATGFGLDGLVDVPAGRPAVPGRQADRLERDAARLGRDADRLQEEADALQAQATALTDRARRRSAEAAQAAQAAADARRRADTRPDTRPDEASGPGPVG
ncbi:MAG: hypothetical protein ABR511_08040, partial [Acidimicrobiales bacterium]